MQVAVLPNVFFLVSRAEMMVEKGDYEAEHIDNSRSQLGAWRQ